MKAQELTDLADNWLRVQFPTATIVRELSVADWGGARIDIAAIDDSMITGVEIKGEGDSPTRLELQGFRYGQVAKHMFLLATPNGNLFDRCRKKKPKRWGLLRVENGNVERVERYRGTSTVEYYNPTESRELNPWAICGTLWRDELYNIAKRCGINLGSRARVGQITDAIIGALPVNRLHDEMIIELRSRNWRKPVIDQRPKEDPKTKGLFDE